MSKSNTPNWTLTIICSSVSELSKHEKAIHYLYILYTKLSGVYKKLMVHENKNSVLQQ